MIIQRVAAIGTLCGIVIFLAGAVVGATVAVFVGPFNHVVVYSSYAMFMGLVIFFISIFMEGP